MINFTAIHLEKEKNKIFDQLGNDIYSISYQKKEIAPVQLPRFKVNVASKKSKNKLLKKPLIRVIVDSNELEKFGLAIVSIPLRPDQIWRPKQKRRLAVVRLGSAEEKIYQKIKSFRNDILGLTKVEFDEANRVIRALGADINQIGVGQWVQVD